MQLTNRSRELLRISPVAVNVKVIYLALGRTKVIPRFPVGSGSDPPAPTIAYNNLVELKPGESRSFKIGLSDASWDAADRQFVPAEKGRYTARFAYQYNGPDRGSVFRGLVSSNEVTFQVE